MEYVILILSIVLFIFSLKVIMGIFEGEKNDGKFLVFILIVYSLIVLLFSSVCIREPKAIDVYKGKATLRITYQDGVPIDSTAVWKR